METHGAVIGQLAQETAPPWPSRAKVLKVPPPTWLQGPLPPGSLLPLPPSFHADKASARATAWNAADQNLQPRSQ